MNAPPDCARCGHWAVAHGFGADCGECRILNRPDPCPGYLEPPQPGATLPPMLFGYPVVVVDFDERSRDGRPYEWRLREIGAKRD